MEEKRANRRMIVLILLGVLVCGGALGFRVFHKKAIHGTWVGYSYHPDDKGKMQPDLEFGQYVIILNENGTYKENCNETSGKWTKKGNHLVLTPTKFYDQTPEQHRKLHKNKETGKVSTTMEMVLKLKMVPMDVYYRPEDDRLVFEEPTLHYEYDRG